MTKPQTHIGHDALTAFVQAVFVKAGLSDDTALIVAQDLVWANLRGADSHGVLRIPLYLKSLDKGFMKSDAQITKVFENGPVTVMDADRAVGPIGMTAAMQCSIEKARSHTIGWTWLKNSSHSGAVGYFARMAIDENMGCFIINAGLPLVAAHGTLGQSLGTNPIVFGCPGRDDTPLIFDMATSAIALGKILGARATGDALPENTVLDKDGQPTTNADAVSTILTMAGHKGSGLSLMIEVFTSLMSDMPLITEERREEQKSGAMTQNALLVAVNIADLMDIGRFAAHVEALVANIKNQPLQDGFTEVLMPGERSSRIYAQRHESGIPLPRKTWDMLLEVADRFALEPPKAR